MSDQSNTTNQGNSNQGNSNAQFGPDGIPLMPQGDPNAPTGLPIDNIPTDSDLTDEQLQDALRKAMRDDDGSFSYQGDQDPMSRRVGADADGATAPDQPDANTWQDANTQTNDTQDNQDLSVSAATQTDPTGQGGDAGSQPFPASPPGPTPGSTPTGELPPGHVWAPISEYNPFTGAEEIRYYPMPADQVGGVLGWVNQMSPQERQAIADYLDAMRSGVTPAASGSGPYPPGSPGQPGVPGGVGQPQQQPIQQPGYQGQPIQPQAIPNQIDYSTLDPEVAALVQAQQAQLQAIANRQQEFERQQAEFQARQLQEDRNRMQAEINMASEQFAQDHNLTPEQAAQLQAHAASLQILPTMHQKHRGDTKAAVRETLETAMWHNPAFRDAAIQAAVTQTAQANIETDARKRRAAAVTGGGGPVPRVAPPARPLTKQEREQAMVQELSQAMNNGQQN